VTALPGELVIRPEVLASDNSSYRQLPRSRPYPPDQAEGRFGAKTGVTLDSVANGADPSAEALAGVLQALRDVEGIFRRHFAESDRIFAAWAARP
jgi:hypothetical protein